MPRIRVYPNGSAVFAARERKGLTQQELADKAGYHKKTIENIENGKPTRPGTLRDIAKALDVPYETLLARSNGHGNPPPDFESAGRVVENRTNDSAQNAGPGDLDDAAIQQERWTDNVAAGNQEGGVAVAHDTVEIDIHISGSIDDFDDDKLAQVNELLKGCLAKPGVFEVRWIRRGSVILRVEIAAEDADRLLRAVRAGRLTEAGVISAEIVEPQSRERAQCALLETLSLLAHLADRELPIWLTREEQRQIRELTQEERRKIVEYAVELYNSKRWQPDPVLPILGRWYLVQIVTDVSVNAIRAAVICEHSGIDGTEFLERHGYSTKAD